MTKKGDHLYTPEELTREIGRYFRACDENTIGKTMPNHPRSTYIESKRFAESAIMNMFSNFFIFRVCLSYGPGAKLNDERVLNQVLLRSIINNSIEVYGGHDQMRANLYIDDSVNLLLRTVSSGNVGICLKASWSIHPYFVYVLMYE